MNAQLKPIANVDVYLYDLGVACCVMSELLLKQILHWSTN